MSQGAFDEAIGPGGAPRPHYAKLLGVLDRLDLSSLASALAEGLSEREVTFRLEGKDDPFRLDPVPRLKHFSSTVRALEEMYIARMAKKE